MADPAIAGAAGVRRAQARVPLLRWTFGLINRIVMVGDFGVILATSLAPFAFGFGTKLMAAQNLLLACIEAAAFVSTLKASRSYRVENYEARFAGVVDLIPGLICAWTVGSIYFAVFEGHLWTAKVIWYWHLPQLAGLVVARLGARLLARRVIRQGCFRRNVVIIGANPAGEAVVSKLLATSQPRQYNVVGIFADILDARQTGTVLGRPILGDIKQVGRLADRMMIDLVIVALPLTQALERVAVMEELQWMATDVVIPMEEIRVAPISAKLASIAGVATLQIYHRPLRGSQAVFKIVEDYVVAAIMLLLLSPLMLLIALVIRVDSKGPVLFHQERIGFNNRPFQILKFRTMTVDPSDDGSVGTQFRDDPRITRVGRFLRRLSLDELPQILNVLRGDMSVVGPRPYVENMLVGTETFRSSVNNYAFRYRLKPGITGLAQASGMRSNALRSIGNARRSIELDLEYIGNWSIWLDFKIMLRTVLVAMSGPEVF